MHNQQLWIRVNVTYLYPRLNRSTLPSQSPVRQDGRSPDGPVRLSSSSPPQPGFFTSAVAAPSTPALRGCPGGEARRRSDHCRSRLLPTSGRAARSPRLRIILVSRLFRPEDAAAAVILGPACAPRSGACLFFSSTADCTRPRPFQAALPSREDPSACARAQDRDATFREASRPKAL